jgi:predicted lipid-binding transport protein (Tim44 family)
VSMTIIVLMALAAFLGLRLYSVLGKRTGHEQQPLPPQPDRTLEPRGPILGVPVGVEPSATGSSTSDRSVELAFEPRAGSGLQSIALADATFDPVRFLEGAKSAYPMILQAYWTGDRETLRTLCDSDVAEAFEAAISAREANGETLDNKFVSFDTATITDAQLDGGIARVVVRFDAYIIAVTRNADGAIIAGSMSDAVEAHDVWTFSRSISSNNPNWTLDETDAV